MSSKDSMIKLLRSFKADVATTNATLGGVTLYKSKDNKLVFIDSKGSKYTLAVDSIQKIILYH